MLLMEIWIEMLCMMIRYDGSSRRGDKSSGAPLSEAASTVGAAPQSKGRLGLPKAIKLKRHES